MAKSELVLTVNVDKAILQFAILADTFAEMSRVFEAGIKALEDTKTLEAAAAEGVDDE